MTRYQTCARYFPRQRTTSDNCAASSKQRFAAGHMPKTLTGSSGHLRVLDAWRPAATSCLVRPVTLITDLPGWSYHPPRRTMISAESTE
jgi:hypothetical protein